MRELTPTHDSPVFAVHRLAAAGQSGTRARISSALSQFTRRARDSMPALGRFNKIRWAKVRIGGGAAEEGQEPSDEVEPHRTAGRRSRGTQSTVYQRVRSEPAEQAWEHSIVILGFTRFDMATI